MDPNLGSFRLGTKKEREAVHVNRLGWEELKGRRMVDVDEFNPRCASCQGIQPRWGWASCRCEGGASLVWCCGGRAVMRVGASRLVNRLRTYTKCSQPGRLSEPAESLSQGRFLWHMWPTWSESVAQRRGQALWIGAYGYAEVQPWALWVGFSPHHRWSSSPQSGHCMLRWCQGWRAPSPCWSQRTSCICPGRTLS